MTSSNHSQVILRQLGTRGLAVENRHSCEIAGDRKTIVGRDRDCQIVLDSRNYPMVSRRHLSIRTLSEGNSWEVCDLASANGTLVNGERLQGCRRLQIGDRLQLGNNGPEFIFETVSKTVSSPLQPLETSSVSLTQLFPIFSTGRDLTRKAYLIPGSLTAIVVVLLFALQNPEHFNFVLGVYIAGIGYYYVYQLCGKHKPWWLLLGSAVMTAILAVPLVTLFAPFFYGILAGWARGENLFATFIEQTLGTGLLEELVKALPVLVVYGWGRLLHPSKQENIGVWEPLDGILLGTASAIGFTLVETLGLYVPNTIQNTAVRAGTAVANLAGLQLLIPRVLGSVCGHMAYSGYLGYFIGLSVLKPRKRWQILGVGYLTSAGLHGMWNTTGSYLANKISPSVGLVALALIGVLSYAFLAAAILKARALSPTRAENFATRMKNY